MNGARQSQGRRDVVQLMGETKCGANWSTSENFRLTKVHLDPSDLSLRRARTACRRRFARIRFHVARILPTSLCACVFVDSSNLPAVDNAITMETGKTSAVVVINSAQRMLHPHWREDRAYRVCSPPFPSRAPLRRPIGIFVLSLGQRILLVVVVFGIV